MRKNSIVNRIKVAIIAVVIGMFSIGINDVYAVDTKPTDTQAQEAMERKSLTIESNGFTD